MFSLNESNRYYLYPYPTDMRKSFYTLSGIVTNQMGKNVRDGDAFIFINANCTCMKILHMGIWWSGDIPYEAGTWALPSAGHKYGGRSD